MLTFFKQILEFFSIYLFSLTFFNFADFIFQFSTHSNHFFIISTSKCHNLLIINQFRLFYNFHFKFLNLFFSSIFYFYNNFPQAKTEEKNFNARCKVLFLQNFYQLLCVSIASQCNCSRPQIQLKSVFAVKWLWTHWKIFFLRSNVKKTYTASCLLLLVSYPHKHTHTHAAPIVPSRGELVLSKQHLTLSVVFCTISSRYIESDQNIQRFCIEFIPFRLWNFPCRICGEYICVEPEKKPLITFCFKIKRTH